MSWVWWLAVPVAATLLAATVTWWRGRPRQPPGIDASMRAHREYLTALTRTPRERGPG